MGTLEALPGQALKHDGTGYEVNVADCKSSRDTLDWIVQVAEKQTYSSEDIGDLVRALAAILRPQQTLCGAGHALDEVIDVRRMLRAG